MLPDITGFTLAEALQILENAGFNNVGIKLTAPPRIVNEEYNDLSRVVRIRLFQETNFVELIVCNI